MKKWGLLICLAAAACFLTAVTRLETQQAALGKQQLETLLRRTAVSCYASEGFYPPSVEYMKSHYGLEFEEERYMVRYERFASNLMPDITVLERLP